MLLMLTVFQFGVTSCKDSEEGMGTPEITGVRVCDPAKADSLFTKSSQGQMIAIIGHDLADAKEVYINGQKVSFSTTMNTANSIIVTVPSEDDTEFNLYTNTNKTLEVITSHGTATYNFSVLGQSPSISRIQGRYPRSAGDTLNVYGTDIYNIKKIYFTDAEPATINTESNYGADSIPGNRVYIQLSDTSNIVTPVRNKITKNNTTYYSVTTNFRFTTPELSFDKGSLVVETDHGTTYISYTKTPGVPVINTISSDMPEIGETLIITGREFVQLDNITYGDVTLKDDDFTVSESEDSIYIPVKKIPSEGSNGLLTVNTPGGSASVSFYDYNTLLVDFDGKGADNGWDPNATYETFDNMSTGNCAHMKISEVGPQWWGTMVFFHGGWTDAGEKNPFTLPDYNVIPSDAPASNVYLAMEVYDNNSDYNNDGTGFSGYLRYVIFPIGADTGADDQSDWTFDNFTWTNYDEGEWANLFPVLADSNNEAHKGKWYRHVVSLNNFPCFAGKTYAEIKALGIHQFRIQSANQSTKSGTVDVRFDNIRLIYLK